jgi:hypothetical protein
MPLIVRDDTMSQDVLYIDDNGYIGINCVPVSGQRLSMNGSGAIDTSGNFGSNVCASGAMIPGIATAYNVPANSSQSVGVTGGNFSSVQLSVGDTNTFVTSVSQSSITVYNNTGSTRSISFSYW